MKIVIYVDFESILLPYSNCDKEDVLTKKLNKQVRLFNLPAVIQ